MLYFSLELYTKRKHRILIVVLDIPHNDYVRLYTEHYVSNENGFLGFLVKQKTVKCKFRSDHSLGLATASEVT